jgi:glycosyltransferase involved in cell wall biosynthesis
MADESIQLKEKTPLKILYVSDFDIVGSGYMNLSIPLCEGLAKRGHDVKAVGVGYRGQEHFFDFSIIPCANIQESLTMFQSIWNMWHYDVLIVAMDVYVHNPFLNILMQKKPFGYVGIMPIEAPPLCMTWAMVISQMDKPFIISEFGAVEARRAGVLEAEHLQIGVDTESWKPASPEEKKAFRNSMLGIDDDTFVVLQVADNQERKNIAAAMEVFKEFAKDKKALYVLVTRENSPVGWRLRDYAQELGILNKFMLFERGMPFKELWMMYACADLFLLTSKTEGLGMPLLEAMSMKIPCVATNATGMAELLAEGRGVLVDHEYAHRDCFGNGTRWWIDKGKALEALNKVYQGELPDIEGARQYVEDRDWQPSVIRLEEVLLKIRSERAVAQEVKA